MLSRASQLGGFVARTTEAEIPRAAFQRVQVSLVHNLAVALAGREHEPGVWRLAESACGQPGTARMLMNGRSVSAEGAAMANGALLHARSQDDTHPASTSHPGAPVMAAALALAEERRSSGAEFLCAVIIGYEVIGRVAANVDQAISARGFRTASTLGVFGAAAAAARLLRCDPEQSAHALALATHMSGGLAQVWEEGSPEWPFQLGLAARNGILAARAAASGLQGARQALEGARGFYNAYAGTAAPEPRRQGSWVVEEATVKPFPACAILQGPLELLRGMRAQHAISPAQLEAIELRLNPFEARYPGIDNPGPFDGATATKMSAQFCLATLLRKGGLTMTDLAAPADAETLAMARRITVVPDRSIPLRISAIEVRTAARAFSAQLDTPVGTPAPAEAEEFALALAGEIGASEAEMCGLLDAIDGLRKAPDVNSLMTAAMSAGLKPSGAGRAGRALARTGARLQEHR